MKMCIRDSLVAFARFVADDDAGAHIAHYPHFFFQRQAQMPLDGVYIPLDGRQKDVYKRQVQDGVPVDAEGNAMTPTYTMKATGCLLYTSRCV